jgi:hypothetical protein
MGIALVGFVVYAIAILVWCSFRKPSVEHVLVSAAVLQRWAQVRSDLIIFELHPDGACRPHPVSSDVLTATPSSLKSLLEWIPPCTTLVMCDRGLSSRSIQLIEQRLTLRNISRIYWVDEVPSEMRTF